MAATRIVLFAMVMLLITGPSMGFTVPAPAPAPASSRVVPPTSKAPVPSPVASKAPVSSPSASKAPVSSPAASKSPVSAPAAPVPSSSRSFGPAPKAPVVAPPPETPVASPPQPQSTGAAAPGIAAESPDALGPQGFDTPSDSSAAFSRGIGALPILAVAALAFV